MPTHPDRLTPGLPFHPWAFLLIFLFANTLLSFSRWPQWVKLSIAVLGVLLPTLIGWLNLREKPSQSGAEEPSLPNPPLWIFVLLGALLLFTQFYHLGSNPFWPIMDDSREDYYALDLTRSWSGSLLYGEGQAQPLYFWILGLLGRLVAPTPLLYRIVPAVLFTCSSVILYLSARKFFPRGRSLLTAAFLAFTFAPYTLSRFHQNMVLTLALECLLFGIWAWYCREEGTFSALGLGLCVGAGCYTFTPWVLAAAWVTWSVAVRAFRTRRFKSPLVYGLSAAAVAGPILLAYLAPHGTDYYRSHFDWSRLGTTYLAAWFWDGQGSAPYGPIWGGWYNPLSGSLMMLGALRVFKERGQAWARSVIGSSLFFFLPGILTSQVEMMRLTLLLPLAALASALGAEWVVSRVRPGKRWWMLLGLLAVSAGLDSFHYLGPYLDNGQLPLDKRYWRSSGLAQAYHLLRHKADREGPGLVLHDFEIQYFDRGLEVASYPFNALQNPLLDPVQAKWLAVVCDSNLQPFLEKRFPEGRWYYLDEPSHPNRGRFTLGILPRSMVPAGTLQRWTAVEGRFEEMTKRALYKKPGQGWDVLEEPLREAEASVGDDPLLWSVFSEKAAMVRIILSDYPGALRITQEGLRRGYPSARLYNLEGNLFLQLGHLTEAIQAYRSALRCPVNRTGAAKHLAQLTKP